MILSCTYEELEALRHGADSVADADEIGVVAEQFAGDLSVATLQEQQALARALETIVETLRVEMDAAVLATHAADEGAVAAYFDFAHALSVLGRVREMGEHMRAMIEVVHGSADGEQQVAGFAFPD